MLPLVVLVVALSLTAVTTYYVHLASTERDQARFRASVEQTRDAIRQRLHLYISLLRGAAGLFASEEHVSRAEFYSFVERMRVAENFPGIQGIGFTAVVEPGEEEQVVQRMRQQGVPDFRLWPEDGLPERHAILYLYPEDRRNKVAIGYNMYSDKIRRDAMARARDTGSPTASGRVMLVQEVDEDVQHGLLIYVPVYEGRIVPSTVEERREKLIGFAYSPFRAGDLLQGILGEWASPYLAFELTDDLDPQGVPLYSYDPAVGRRPPNFAPLLEASEVLPIAGRNWVIRFHSTPAFAANSHANMAVYTGLAGVVVAVMLFALTYSEARARGEAQREVAVREQAERELAYSERRLRTLVEQAPISIQVLSSDGRTTQANEAFQRLWGLDGQGFQNYNILEDQELERVGLLDEIRQAFTGKIVYLEPRQFLLQRGSGFEVSRWVAGVAYPLKDHEGKVHEVVLIHQDLTDVKVAEEEVREINASLEHRVRQRTEELATAIGEMEAFSYSVAHDLRSPLRAMAGFARILQEEHGQKLAGEASKLLDRIQENALKMGGLIDGLLDLARVSRTQIERDEVDLSAMAEEILGNALRRQPRPHAEIRIQAGLTVFADPRLMQNVLQNLLENAWKFSEHAPRAVIEVGSFGRDGDTVYYVRDSGAGFDQQYAGRLFGAFERLHDADEFPGMGIGLATVRRIIERHGGTVWAEGEVGRGATFFFTVPPEPPNSEGEQDSDRRSGASLI